MLLDGIIRRAKKRGQGARLKSCIVTGFGFPLVRLRLFLVASWPQVEVTRLHLDALSAQQATVSRCIAEVARYNEGYPGLKISAD